MSRRSLSFAGAALAVAVAIPAHALASGHGASARRVNVKDYAFAPSRLSVARGDSVTWSWSGRSPHNVHGTSFHGSRIMARGSFTARFTRQGTFRYVCTVHPWMVGTVSVR